MSEHRLKTWPSFFAEVATGAKTFEIRKNDRDFRVGDVLVLVEYDPDTNTYSGDEMKVMVTYSVMLDDIPGMPEGFIGMSIEHKSHGEAKEQSSCTCGYERLTKCTVHDPPTETREEWINKMPDWTDYDASTYRRLIQQWFREEPTR